MIQSPNYMCVCVLYLTYQFSNEFSKHLSMSEFEKKKGKKEKEKKKKVREKGWLGEEEKKE